MKTLQLLGIGIDVLAGAETGVDRLGAVGQLAAAAARIRSRNRWVVAVGTREAAAAAG